jgi:undecaprenyl-diphosphatase
MNIFQAIILGLVEGVTEFVPISSSGHLIIARQIMGLQSSNGLLIDAVLQMGTIVALGVYFFPDLWKILKNFIAFCLRKPLNPEDKTMVLAIIYGTIPAIIFGLLLQKEMETIFRSVHLVAITLLVGAALMYCAEKFGKADKILSPMRGFVVGLFQCLALVPGVSRSGATISGGLFAGLNRESAVRFSFLLSFPIIFGSGLKALWDVHKAGILATGGVGTLVLGSVVAFISGLVAIHFLIKYLKTHDLKLFIGYRVIVAILVLIFL